VRRQTGLLHLARIHQHDPIALDFDLTLASEQIEQNGNPLPRRNDPRDQHSQPAKRATGDDNFRSRLRISGHFYGFVVANQGAQIGHDRIVDGGDLLAEMDNGRNPGERINLSAPFEVFEPGKKIAREKRFRRPKRLATTHPAKANARSKNFNAQLTLQDKRDFILLLGGGMKAIPVQLANGVQ
jgi:hypothetical protein